MIRKSLYTILKNFYKRNILDQEKISYVLDNYNSEDRGFFTKVLNYTIRNHVKIDFILKKLIKNYKSIPPASKTFLRLGVSQLLLGIDEYASVNETVKLIKNKKQKNFVNAVLRNFIRNKEEILKKLPKNVVYSYPKWVFEKIKFLKHRNEIMNKHIKEPNITIRINTLITDKESMIKKFDELGIKTKNSIHFENSLIIENNKDILLSNNLYEEGYYYIQNESSQLVSHILNPKNNENILDACSAPGGKTTHLAELMNNKGNILAFENDIIRLEKVNSNAKRLNINIINTELIDSSNVDLNNNFDKILIDAPCTSAGISSIHPEVLLRLDEENIELYSKLQRNILSNLIKQAEKGTEFVYSTCTIFKEENTENMMNIKEIFDIDFIDIKKDLKKHNIKSQFDKYGHYIVPDETLIPFYIAKFVKK
ncbi:MAG: transcription antitermination factor NusB [Thermotogota bacterium]